MSAQWLGRCILVSFSSGFVYLLTWLYVVPLVPLLGPLFPPQHWALIIPTALFIFMIIILGSFTGYIFLREVNSKTA